MNAILQFSSEALRALGSIFSPLAIAALVAAGIAFCILVLVGLAVVGLFTVRLAFKNAARRSLQPIAATGLRSGTQDSGKSPWGKKEGGDNPS